MVASFGGPIFVHVPKTGGTTMIAALRQQSWQPNANDVSQSTPFCVVTRASVRSDCGCVVSVQFHYRHIVYQTTQSTTADLFDLPTLP